MFGFGKKESKGKVEGVYAEFKACKGCTGHVPGCMKADDELATMFGIPEDHPKRAELLKKAKTAAEAAP